MPEQRHEYNAEMELEKLRDRFDRRYRLKKKVNAVLCLVIVFCGVTAVLYSIFIHQKQLLDRFRYMTFNATFFTVIISFIFAVVCLKEASDDTEVTNRIVYFLRLSSAVTELVVLGVVLFGLTPLVPDQPDVTSYTGVMTHLVVPLLTILSFSFNDAPIGKLRPWESFYGTWFVTIYAVVMGFLFGKGILPSELAPYSFLDFEHSSLLFMLACLAGIYAFGYMVALMLSWLNRKLSWIWFYDFRKLKDRM